MAIRPETDIDTFLALDIHAGEVVRAEAFPEANKPSIKLWIDFGDDVGTRTSSGQLTRRYSPDDLVGTSVLGVVNFPPRRIAGFVSEVLVLGVGTRTTAGTWCWSGRTATGMCGDGDWRKRPWRGVPATGGGVHRGRGLAAIIPGFVASRDWGTGSSPVDSRFGA